MSSEKNNEETETVAEVVEAEEETIEKLKLENVEKIKLFIEELNKLKHKGGPDFRVCPRCFSLRVKKHDVLGEMAVQSSYPVYICLDCGWRSKKWLYLDRSMTKDDRDKFVKKLVKEKSQN